MSYLKLLASTPGWTKATETVDFDSLERQLCFNLPADYRAFLVQCGGFEGTFGASYMRLHRVADLLLENRNTLMHDFFPGMLAIGGDGGGEMYCINCAAEPAEYVVLPCIGDVADALPQGQTLESFLERAFNGRLFER